MIRLPAKTTFARFALVLLSLLLALWHFGPLNGTLAALLLTVGGQVYLLGYLGARAAGLLREAASAVERLAWVVVCGLGISITLGAAARLLLIPPSTYVIGLHVVMLALSFAPAAPMPRLRFDRKVLPHYALLALVCVIFAVVGWERNRLRFDGYEDQTLLVSLTDWWAHHLPPENLVSRNIAETNALTYWSSDGLTYVLASWVWTSGVSAVQLIWYALTPLFGWLVPVAHFALAKKVTGRDDTAAWATAFVLLLALTTADGVVRYSGFWTFGQQAAFQLDTLRTFSTALMLPLALFAFLTSLRTPSLRYTLTTGIFALALALTHPRQFLVVVTAFYAILAVWWLVAPSRLRLWAVMLVGLPLIPALLIPLWQYSGVLSNLLNATTAATTNNPLTPIMPSADAAVGVAATAPIPLDYVVQLPILGRVIDPAALFYHPLIGLALACGIASVTRLRRSLAAQLIFTTSALLLAMAFVQPILDVLIRLLNPYYAVRFALGFVLVVPVGLILGIALAGLHERVGRRGHTLIASGLAALALMLLIEPIPIPGSARDQIVAANEQQALRDIQPFDEMLLDDLQKLPQTGDRAIYLTPNRLASFVMESVPGTFVTAGRSMDNPAFEESMRFYDRQAAPWLDSADLSFLKTYGVDIVVVTADSTRLLQLALQPERFEPVAAVAGYRVFRVGDIGTLTGADRAFADMNALYEAEAEASRRWDGKDFDLSRGVDAVPWQKLIAEWRALRASDPANDLIRYGLAFASLMAGDDQPEEWAALRAAHPDLFALTDAYAHILREHDQPGAALDVLTATLDAPDETARVLAARSLLSERFFYLLTPETLDQIVALADSGSTIWAQLMEWDQADGVRERAALLLSAGRLDEAARWLERIPDIEVSPRDLATRAAVRLAQGDEAGARALLSTALDGDMVSLRAHLHPERWTPNENAAARMAAALDALPSNLSPRLITDGGMFAQGAQVEESNGTLIVTATVGNFTPALPVREVTAQVTSPDSTVIYGEALLPVTVDAGGFARAVVSVDLPDDLPPLTPAHVIIRTQYSPAVVYMTLAAETILNRPMDVRLPDEAQRVDLRFGDHITLVGYTTRADAGALDVTLYWQTDAALAEDDQVTVQLFDAAGERQAQHDAAPDDGRYPTRFWLPDTLIADEHHLTVTPGEYTLIVGMYHLADLTRLPITPSDGRVQDNLLRLGQVEAGK